MKNAASTSRRARRLGGLLAGSLALGLVPLASPASATHTLPAQRNIRQNACPATPLTGAITSSEVPEDGFTDVPSTNVHEFAIDCVRWYRVTSGRTPTTYVPGGTIRRDQLATFVAQMIDYVADRTAADDGLDDAGAGNLFPCDVNTNNVHFDNIQRLAKAGVVKGSGNSTAGACFDPAGTVTRGQMATFIREASRVAGEEIAAALETEDYFVDDETSAHEANINAITKAGLAAGAGHNTNNENTFLPNDVIRRDQMASLIATTLDRLVDGANAGIRPPIANVTTDPPVNIPKGTDVKVTSDPDRGTINSITASGCGAAAKTSAAPNLDEVTLSIPATQASGDCNITVVTNFADVASFGGQGRSETDVVKRTITS